MRLLTILILGLSLSLAQASELPKSPTQQTVKKAGSKKTKMIKKKSNAGSKNKAQSSKTVK